MKSVVRVIFVVYIALSLAGCKSLFPNILFQQNNYQFFELAQKEIDRYVMQPGDQITVKVYSRDGFKLIDVIDYTSSQGVPYQPSVNYVVDNEGFVNLPIIGNVFVKGYSESELEKLLADKYASLFVDPYVVVKVENRRVFVFRGNTATVVLLNESPTTLIEVLAKAGGFDEQMKADNIKIIRGDLKNPQVTIVNLSTIEGMRKANLILQSNDIVYVDRRRNGVVASLREITPFLSVLATISTIILIILRIDERI